MNAGRGRDETAWGVDMIRKSSWASSCESCKGWQSDGLGTPSAHAHRVSSQRSNIRPSLVYGILGPALSALLTGPAPVPSGRTQTCTTRLREREEAIVP